MYYLCLKIHFPTPMSSLNYMVLKIRFVTNFVAGFLDPCSPYLCIVMIVLSGAHENGLQDCSWKFLRTTIGTWCFSLFYLDRHACMCFGHFLCLFKSAKCTVLRYATYLLSMYTTYQLIRSSYDAC